MSFCEIMDFFGAVDY